MSNKSTAVTRKAPHIARGQVMVAALANLAHELRCAREAGIGCEVQCFMLPEHLSGDVMAAARRFKKRLQDLKGTIGFHGAFIDTVHYSTDPEIAAVARRRYHQAFELAELFEARYIVFHSQYNPSIKVPIYPRLYHEQSLRFWPEFIALAERKNIPIYLENMFDDSPQPVSALAKEFDSPHLKLCLDVAHAEIFSDIDFGAWVDAYGPHLRHVHINDCMGELDDHLGLGQGVLDIPRAISLLKRTRLPLTYVLETGKHTGASLRYLGLAKGK
ncbi:MAG: hypothetical protein AMXMBFR84_46590 [Candidatus Hydrogenedentota bacterium]